MAGVQTTALPPNVDIAPTVIHVLSCTLAVAIVVLATRIYIRAKVLRKLWWDDYTICLAIPLTLFGFATIVVSARHGFGRHLQYVQPRDIEYVARWDFYRLVCWLWSTMLIRVSVGLQLLRVKSRPLWTASLCTVIALAVITALAGTILNCIQCIPIQANWDHALPGAKCWRPAQIQIVLYTVSSINIFIDFFYSVLPLTFILDMHLPVVEKVILVMLMSLGLFASASGIIKITKFNVYSIIEDPTWNTVPAALWSRIEEHLGIIAASVPSLRGPFRRGLQHLKLLSSRKSSSKSSGGFNFYKATVGHHGVPGSVRTDEIALDPVPGHWAALRNPDTKAEPIVASSAVMEGDILAIEEDLGDGEAK